MTRKSKTSRRSNDSRSPYESNEDDYNSVSNSITNAPVIDDQLSSNITKTPSYPPPIPYINVAPLPIFHGNPEECPLSHLSRFIKVCRANNASSTNSMLRIFPVTLESEASIWYDLNIEPYPTLSWDEIMASFSEAYNKIEAMEELRTELMMLSQKNGEAVRSYFLRIQLILKKLGDHGFTDNVLKGIFAGGLMEDFREWVVSRRADSLNEALSLAFSYEKMKRSKKGLKCGFCGGLHDEKGCKVKERMRELFRKKKENSNKGTAENENKKNDGEEHEEENRRCQCSKHQCWNKKLERNTSILSKHSTTDQ
ncbi:hypothetical protein M5689_006176 [Euphorbia peplus]|nr:hypothetical protein M5689_006176 [Euphorbia peplus]